MNAAAEKTELHIGQNLESQVSKNGQRSSTYDFDVILKHLGRLGRYRTLLIAFAYYATLSSGMHGIGSVFLLAVPEHRCHIPGVDNNGLYASYPEEYLLNISTPVTDQGQNGCKMYDYNYTSCSNETFDCLDISSKPPSVPCEAYVYSKDVYGATAAVEWNLVCDRLLIITTSISSYFLGALVGFFFGGNIIDNFGRRYVMLVADIGKLIAGIICAFSPSILVFSITRFIVSALSAVHYTSGFVYVMEITSGKWQTIAGINYQAGYALGYSLLSAMAYRWRDWRELQLAMSMVSVPFVIMWIFMPESPRWLFAKGRDKEGKAISQLIARRNGMELPENIWEEASSKLQIHHSDKKYNSVLTLFRRPRMRIVSFIVMICWFMASFTYFGLSLNIGAFSGDVYVNNALSGIAEIVSCPIAVVILKKFGRKNCVCVAYLVTGILCIAASVMTSYSDKINVLGTLGTILALFGKLGISGAYAILFCFTAELYPTIVRATAIGLGGTIAVVATMLTPYALYLQNFVSWLPGVSFGAALMLAGLISFKLPETKNCPMMTTLDEAEEFYGGKT